MNASLKILQATCDTCRVDFAELRGSKKTQGIAWARHIAADLLRKNTNLSYPQIGSILGNRDHTTIMHSVRRSKQLRVESDMFALMYAGASESAERLLSQ